MIIIFSRGNPFAAGKSFLYTFHDLSGSRDFVGVYSMGDVFITVAIGVLQLAVTFMGAYLSLRQPKKRHHNIGLVHSLLQE